MTDEQVVLAMNDVHLSLARRGEAHAPILRGVTLELRAGEILGLVGESGSGKSMTARVMAGLLPRDAKLEGGLNVLGMPMMHASDREWRKLRSSGVGMIFQDPRAHIDPVRSVGDFLVEALVQIRKMTRASALARAAAALEEVGVSDPEARLRQYPHELSGGLLQRVMIASTLLMEPSVLLADEPTTALDVTTQSELMSILQEQQRARGMAVLFITHDLDLAAAISHRVAVMYAGQVVELGSAQVLDTAPRHPYTEALLDSRPRRDTRGQRLATIAGSPISAAEARGGCAFRDRCRHAIDDCSVIDPPLVASGSSLSRCLIDHSARARSDHDD